MVHQKNWAVNLFFKFCRVSDDRIVAAGSQFDDAGQEIANARWSTMRWNIRCGHLLSRTNCSLSRPHPCKCRMLILIFTRPKSKAQSGGYNSARLLRYRIHSPITFANSLQYGVNVLMIHFTNARKYPKLVSVSSSWFWHSRYGKSVVMWWSLSTVKESKRSHCGLVFSVKVPVNIYLSHFKIKSSNL